MQIFIDSTGNSDFASVRQESLQPYFLANSSQKINFGFTDSTYWLKIALKNHSLVDSWVLEIDYPLLDSIELYMWQHGRYVKKNSGDTIQFHRNNAFFHHAFNFNLPIPSSGEVYDVFVKVQTKGGMVLPVKLYSQQEFVKKATYENYLLGAYLGAVVIIGLYNFFLFLSIRDRSYLYYLFYVFTFGLLQASLTGISHQTLWEKFPYFANKTPVFFVPLSLFAALLFSQRFLFLKQRAVHLRFGFRLAIFCALLLSALAFYIDYSILVRCNTYFTIVVCLYLLYAAYHCWREGFLPAKYYMLAWGVLLLFLILHRLRLLGVVPHNLFTNHGIRVGSMIEMALLSLALGYRINLLRSQKEQMQYEIQQEKTLSVLHAELRAFTEREKIWKDLHDHLNGDLVEVNYGMQKLLQSSMGENPSLLYLQVRLEQVIDLLRSRLQTVDNQQELEEDFLEGIQLFLIQRYSSHTQERKLLLDVDDRLADVLQSHFTWEEKKQLYAIVKEVSTNDLKYGYGSSNWEFSFEEFELSLSMNSMSSYQPGQKPGLGANTIRERAEDLGAHLTSSLQVNRFHLHLQISLAPKQ